MNSCCYCSNERKSPKARGWHQGPDGLSCPACWKQNWIPRAIALPVQGVLTKEAAGEKPVEEWKRLREALQISWQEATALANWAVIELLKQDTPRTSDMSKQPKFPSFNLYAHMNKFYCRQQAWDGATTSAAAILRSVENKWKKDRWKVLWLNKDASPTYQYPFPWPVPAANWLPYWDGQHFQIPCVSLTLPGGRFELRLRGGPEFRRQLTVFGQLVKDPNLAGELSVYRQRTSNSNHQLTLADREPGGGRKQQYREMIKLVYWMRRARSLPEATRTLLVRTDPHAFWVAELEGRQPWILNADHVKQWIAEHRCFLQRISEDTKYEKRWPRRKRIQINEHREARCEKQKRRLDTWCKQAAALLINYAKRNMVGTIIYDDVRQEYLESFCWFKLKACVANKAEEQGIQLIAKEETESDENVQVA